MAETAKKKTTTNRKVGAGRKPLTTEEKNERKEKREIEKALEILKKYKLEAVPVGTNDIRPDSKCYEEPQKTSVPKPSKRNLPADVYSYRYIMNTCQAGAIHLGDIGVFVEVDENFRNVVRFTEEDFSKSRQLGTHIAKGNLIEVTSEYIQFLENGNSVNDWTLWFRPSEVRMESTNFYPYKPKVRRDMIDQNNSPIVDEDDISRVHGTSDMASHMAAAKQNFRPNAQIESIEAVLDSVDVNNNPIANENIADRSNPANFVDPRMSSSKRMPKSPSVHVMRDGQLALTNEREIYPYTEDHHEREMIAQNAQTPYVHVPGRANLNQPIYEALPQHMSDPRDRVQTISQQQAKALYQQKMNQSQPQPQQQGPQTGPQISNSAQDLLNRS